MRSPPLTSTAETGGGVLVSEITKASMFARSNLKEGMKFLSVNDTDCWSFRKDQMDAFLKDCEEDTETEVIAFG